MKTCIEDCSEPTAGGLFCRSHGDAHMEQAEAERDRRVINQLYSDIGFTPGMGDGGRQIEIVEKSCGRCGYDRAVRTTTVSPEWPTGWEFSCQNPNCSEHKQRIPFLRSR